MSSDRTISPRLIGRGNPHRNKFSRRRFSLNEIGSNVALSEEAYLKDLKQLRLVNTLPCRKSEEAYPFMLTDRPKQNINTVAASLKPHLHPDRHRLSLTSILMPPPTQYGIIQHRRSCIDITLPEDEEIFELDCIHRNRIDKAPKSMASSLQAQNMTLTFLSPIEDETTASESGICDQESQLSHSTK